MSKFAGSSVAVASPVKTVPVSDTTTAEGGAGFSRDAKSELFLLAVTNMVGEKTFYEDGKARDDRFERLIRQTTSEDPAWIARFVPYLRDTMNMRSASLVMAAEYVRAGGPNGRAVIASALRRADEPAEMVGYWIGRYGKRLPQPVKRGVADAVVRLYNENAALKYAGDKGVRMADVIELVHPKPSAPWQGALFEYLIAKRHNRERLDTILLPRIAARIALEAIPAEGRRARLTDGLPEGTTWEWASSWLGGALSADFWQAMIPNMGIFALVRNLRNFDDAAVGPETQASVLAKIADAETIAKSRMFPLRFYSAWKNTATMAWGGALETAIGHSLANVPTLTGRTLVLVDISGSMDSAMSDKSKATRYELAGIFGAAIAVRAEDATLVAFESNSYVVPHRGTGSVLRLMDAISKAGPHGGTETFQAIARHFDKHDRIIIITDEQAHVGYGYHSLPDVPIYTFNVAGYAAAHMPSGSKHHTFGGLSDSAFVALSLLERSKDAGWPF